MEGERGDGETEIERGGWGGRGRRRERKGVDTEIKRDRKEGGRKR